MQIAQAVHAAFAFTRDFPALAVEWLRTSNYLVIVAVPDEAHLLDLITQAHQRGVTHTGVREPDLDNEATAVVLGPGPDARKLCANLPLALRQPAMT